MKDTETKDQKTKMLSCGCYWFDTVLGLVVNVCPAHEAAVLGVIQGHVTENDQG